MFKGISHPVFYGDLVYKLRRVKDTPNFISSGSKIVKRLRRWQYDPLIIERTIALVLGPCTALYRPFLKHCTLTNKAFWTIWRALSKPPQRRQGPDLRPLWLLVGTPSDNSVRRLLLLKMVLHSLFADAIVCWRPNSAYADPFSLICSGSICIKKTLFHSGRNNFKSKVNTWA